jgi:hypothetical protein
VAILVTFGVNDIGPVVAVNIVVVNGVVTIVVVFTVDVISVFLQYSAPRDNFI